MSRRFGLSSGTDSGNNLNSLEIEASKLKEMLDRGDDVFVLDVRTPEEYDAWRLSYDKQTQTPLIPIDQLFAMQKSLGDKIPKDKEVITLCAHGNRSMMAAQILSSLGYNVKSVRGGMAAWNQVYDIAEIPISGSDSVRVWQIRRVSKGCMSYLVASKDSNAAVVIDPSCNTEGILGLAESQNLKITHVLDTHMHADHVSGLTKLCSETGATGHLSSLEGYAPAGNLPFRLLSDGSRVELSPAGGSGSCYIAAVHSPGHTDGSMCFELNFDNKVLCLFTGDTLFVDAVGRPDLRDRTEEFAAKLYETYQSRIFGGRYPEDTVILPAHFDPSAVTLSHGKAISETLGGVRKNVPFLSKSKDEFVKSLTTSIPPRPLNYRIIIRINKELSPCDQFNTGDLEAGPNSCAVRM
ncbi:MAG: MBL fold metallo-hydrolase [Nitrososphaera sp.]|jgi:glyoxylase-like metal-dependent hydrolase (beta-lactamase superfamily II)/rhodanese-related sulfurtransferase